MSSEKSTVNCSCTPYRGLACTKCFRVKHEAVRIEPKKQTVFTERVHFRLINMPCCGHMFCNVNHRWPSFCPNCGVHVFPQVKGCAAISDDNATLKYDSSKQP